MIRWINKYFMFNPWEWHHLYTGIIVYLLGIHYHSHFWMCVGFWLIVDDIGQHRLQRVNNNSHYYSYGHYIGKPVYWLRRWLVEKTGWKWLYRI